MGNNENLNLENQILEETAKMNAPRPKDIKIHLISASAYSTKHQRLYGKRIIGINDDGSFRLGPWDCLSAGENGDKIITVPGDYAEFGFEFDIVWGTDWPYSNRFWTIERGPAENILIEWGGTVRMATIKISVNNDLIFYDSNCSSHVRYNFNH